MLTDAYSTVVYYGLTVTNVVVASTLICHPVHHSWWLEDHPRATVLLNWPTDLF